MQRKVPITRTNEVHLHPEERLDLHTLAELVKLENKPLRVVREETAVEIVPCNAWGKLVYLRSPSRT